MNVSLEEAKDSLYGGDYEGHVIDDQTGEEVSLSPKPEGKFMED